MISNEVEMALVRTACQHHSPAWHAKGRSSESTNPGLMLTLCRTNPPAWNRQHNFCLFTCCKFCEAPIRPHGTGSAIPLIHLLDWLTLWIAVQARPSHGLW